jgi:glutaminyl-tRNA synthetase
MCEGQDCGMGLRLKIDPGNPNPTLRDPFIYRVKGPQALALYDFAHPLCDSLEGISHSLCTL